MQYPGSMDSFSIPETPRLSSLILYRVLKTIDNEEGHRAFRPDPEPRFPLGSGIGSGKFGILPSQGTDCTSRIALSRQGMVPSRPSDSILSSTGPNG
ncbi:unnamed protein product [Mycena citricolor]|uniref:Uncharacterized protein n=1 Tax=Mycena citricolor TaxID=2018698 RepID=A0AAD2JXV3_9AGAR|nr:unnamed protein product [Mycena citricolor]